MSAKTRIVVLHMKEVIYTAIFIGLGIVLVILLLFMFLPRKQETASASTMQYAAGVYTSSVMIGNQAADIQVIVDKDRIQSISLVHLDETVTTMYPLMEPALESISQQVIQQQSTQKVTYQTENQYTSIVLLNAIENALAKAQLTDEVAE